MKRIYCDLCNKEVKEESDLWWVDISPFYRRQDEGHFSVKTNMPQMSKKIVDIFKDRGHQKCLTRLG